MRCIPLNGTSMKRAGVCLLLLAIWMSGGDARAQAEDDSCRWINAEYLRWTARQDSTPYTGIITAPVNNLNNQLSAIDNDYSPDNGCRVGAGWRFCMGMDVSVD